MAKSAVHVAARDSAGHFRHRKHQRVLPPDQITRGLWNSQEPGFAPVPVFPMKDAGPATESVKFATQSMGVLSALIEHHPISNARWRLSARHATVAPIFPGATRRTVL